MRNNQVQFVKDNFIPVALDLNLESRRKDAAGDFFRQINKARPGGIPYFTSASGRIHAMTADGRFFHCEGKGCRDCDARAALESWRKLPESQRRPRGPIGAPGKVDPTVPTPPPGALILQVYESRLAGDKGELRRRDRAETFSWGVYEPGRTYVWIREDEWKALVTAGCKKGDRCPLPTGVANRLIPCLTDWSEANGAHWKSEHVRSSGLTLTVEEVSPAGIQLRLDGSVRLAHDAPKGHVRYHPSLRALHHEDPKAFARCDARLLGHLTYDAQKKAFSRFDVVALGEYVGPLLNPYRTEDGRNYYLIRPCPLGVVFEIAPPGRVVPPSDCLAQ